MSIQKTTSATLFRQSLPIAGTPRRNALLIWLDAWREYSKLHKLSTDALADMGLTETDRNSVTVSHIATRMRTVG